MENISVNNLVEEFQSSLPREISISIAKNILNSKISKENAISEYKKNIGLLEKKIQRQVINCTGTLLHTNLGRAQINPEFTGGRSNIEYDLDQHKRGKMHRRNGMIFFSHLNRLFYNVLSWRCLISALLVT